MKTEYIGAYKVRDGYNGHIINVFLVFDPDRRAVLEVTPCGYHLAALPPCFTTKQANNFLDQSDVHGGRYTTQCG